MSKAKVHHPPRGSSKASLVQNQWRTLHHRALRARRPRPPCRTLQTPQVTSYHRTRSANRGHCLLTARCGCKVGACKCLKPVSQKVANYFLCWKNFVRLAWREASSASRQSASLRLLAPAVLTRMICCWRCWSSKQGGRDWWWWELWWCSWWDDDGEGVVGDVALEEDPM